MATIRASRLLSVPKEIRDRIYDECLIDITLSSSTETEIAKDWQPRVTVTQTVSLSLLLVCGQVYDECTERANSAKGSGLLVDLAGSNVFSAASLGLEAMVPAASLRKVKRCRVTIPWSQIRHAENKGFSLWLSRAAAASPSELALLNEQSATPTKALCTALHTFLNILRNTISEDARVTIAVSFSGHPDLCSTLSPEARLARERVTKYFHAPTFLALPSDAASTWPPRPKLRVTCCAYVPLYSVWHDRRVGRTQDDPITVEDVEEAAVVDVLWELTPSSDPNDWQSFFPRMLATTNDYLMI
ncbi:hypothetical protein LTR17_005629 [Elasticomyces elasticus]|nr:hypothetical protein LTR17_005629 [Elasticomyces elasticus]